MYFSCLTPRACPSGGFLFANQKNLREFKFMAMYIRKSDIGTFTHVYVESTYDSQVLSYVEKYLKEFPYPGYMTKVERTYWVDEHSETPRFVAEIKRLSSCD